MWIIIFYSIFMSDGRIGGCYFQARSQDLEKGGAILKEWEKCKRPLPEFLLFLNQFQTVCPKIQTKVLGKLGNSKVFSAQNKVVSKKKKKGLRRNWDRFFGRNPKFKGFFRPKTGLKKKKKKKRTSPKLKPIFRPNSEIQTFEGGYFQFFTKNRPQKY